jgi:hypothetical protein
MRSRGKVCSKMLYSASILLTMPGHRLFGLKRFGQPCEVVCGEMIDAWLVYFRQKFSLGSGLAPTGWTEGRAPGCVLASTPVVPKSVTLRGAAVKAARSMVCLRGRDSLNARTACILARLLACLNVPAELALERLSNRRSLSHSIRCRCLSALRRRASKSLAMQRYHTMHQPPRVAGAFLV